MGTLVVDGVRPTAAARGGARRSPGRREDDRRSRARRRVRLDGRRDERVRFPEPVRDRPSRRTRGDHPHARRLREVPPSGRGRSVVDPARRGGLPHGPRDGVGDREALPAHVPGFPARTVRDDRRPEPGLEARGYGPSRPVLGLVGGAGHGGSGRVHEALRGPGGHRRLAGEREELRYERPGRARGDRAPRPGDPAAACAHGERRAAADPLLAGVQDRCPPSPLRAARGPRDARLPGRPRRDRGDARDPEGPRTAKCSASWATSSGPRGCA